jgi:hypothetical protein
VAPLTIEQVLRGRFRNCDLVLAKAVKKIPRQQRMIAELGRVYRLGHLFESRQEALISPQFEFVSGGGSWGEVPNYEGEVGFLFLVTLPPGNIYQDSWHGHIPIERHDDGLWCLLYQWKLWAQETVPEILRTNSKPSFQRLSLSDGEPFDTWVRFEAMEFYLMSLIADIDQKPCEPIDVSDITPWLESVKRA